MAEKLLHLQPRLRCLAELVPQRARLADIGTDHGYIPVYLLQRGRIDRAIAADIGAEPLAHARRTAQQYGLEERVELRLCDGLTGIGEEETDCILIAGMGGETIISILQGAAWLHRGDYRLLLQPQSRQELLRIWLAEHGFRILREHFVRDKGTLYNVMEVEPGAAALPDEIECCCGVNAEEDPLYGAYLTWQIQKLEQRLSGLHRSSNTDAQTRIAECERLLQRLRERKGAWQHDNGS